MDISDIRMDIPDTIDHPENELLTVADLVAFLQKQDQTLKLTWAGERNRGSLILLAPYPSTGHFTMCESTNSCY